MFSKLDSLAGFQKYSLQSRTYTHVTWIYFKHAVSSIVVFMRFRSCSAVVRLFEFTGTCEDQRVWRAMRAFQMGACLMAAFTLGACDSKKGGHAEVMVLTHPLQ